MDKHWKPKYASDPENLAESTLVVYEQHLQTHILPKFGGKRLDNIETMHVVDFMAYLKTPEARKMVSLVCLETALSDSYCAYSAMC